MELDTIINLVNIMHGVTSLDERNHKDNKSMMKRLQFIKLFMNVFKKYTNKY